MSQQEVTCTHCGGQHLRHFAVEIFDRKEDASEGNRLMVVTPGGDADTPAQGGFRLDYEAGALMEVGSNPSSRRHGLVVEMVCEECEEITALTVAQHKGQTLLGLAKVSFPDEGAP